MTTIDFQSAQSALDRELVRLESLGVLRDALREVGGLQQAADEAGKRLDAARAAEASAKADLAAIELQVENAKAEIIQAQAAADDLITKAKVAGAAIEARARAEAERIVADAKTQSEQTTRRAAVLADAIRAAAT
jgi:F0F1-type ATP synthase membrane subunit b/b'